MPITKLHPTIFLRYLDDFGPDAEQETWRTANAYATPNTTEIKADFVD